MVVNIHTMDRDPAPAPVQAPTKPPIKPAIVMPTADLEVETIGMVSALYKLTINACVRRDVCNRCSVYNIKNRCFYGMQVLFLNLRLMGFYLFSYWFFTVYDNVTDIMHTYVFVFTSYYHCALYGCLSSKRNTYHQ